MRCFAARNGSNMRQAHGCRRNVDLSTVPPQRCGCRAGFVLVAALVALVLIALLITGAFFASGQELAVARNEIRDQQAFEFAEYGLARAIAGWDAPARESMTVGQTTLLAPILADPLESSVFVTKLDTALFLVVADGHIATSDALDLRRRVGILVRSVVNGATAQPPVPLSEQAWSELY
jgi:type II secretory pathway pseudopilin PulG